ncbi:prenyltransferase/squalene oxidase repeat-containing protein [Streptomyces gobitricini]|uniref:Squalene--hopene cyclase n=1 Tax=Streptomyces gobitricini TaxID=68211 RepID=A0ABN3MZY3_9ACTN
MTENVKPPSAAPHAAVPHAAPAPPLPTPRTAHRRATDRLLAQQRPDGCWEGEMVWNTMILSQYVIVAHIVGRPTDPREREAMVQHYRTTVTADGGWGLHPESATSMYCTVLAHVALRLLGEDPDGELCRRAVSWMRAQPGGVPSVPGWGKFWLALVGLYDYRDVAPAPPEIFLLPRRAPVHPDRLYCHTRAIYQAMAYLYGCRYRAGLGPLGGELRAELFGEPDAPPRAGGSGPSGHGALPRGRRASGPDVHVPPGRLLRAVYALARGYERRPARRVRDRALERCRLRVVHEQRVTAGLGISPVSALLNVLVLHHSRPGSGAADEALAALAYWRWEDHDGIRYAGARSHTWDTAFAVEALLADGTATGATGRALDRATAFLRGAQVSREVPDPAVTGRSPALGGWCFSEGGHRWPVSDCTAEAVAALLHVRGRLPREAWITPGRVGEAALFLLDRQNRDGGFGTYERRRGPRWLEALNPAEMFSDCVVEGSYVECTGSALVALASLPPGVPGLSPAAVARARKRAVAFLLRGQDGDGSWPAAWGVNRIYGTWFAVRGLRAAGLPAAHPALRRAADWLRAVQRADGGWGEHHRGCTENRYVEHRVSQPVSTAWALLALMEVARQDDPAVEAGVRWLCARQEPDGTWVSSSVNGVFFGTAMLDYRLYVSYFPAWALGRWLRAADAGSGGPGSQ